MHATTSDPLQHLADQLTLDGLLSAVTTTAGPWELVAHWTQGEFHHDVVLRVGPTEALPAPVLVVATNCNGGVKEVLAFEDVPDRWALWRWRCPDNAEFEGELGPIVGQARTAHWFDPCELLVHDARSELKPSCRSRQRGGGWVLRSDR